MKENIIIIQISLIIILIYIEVKMKEIILWKNKIELNKMILIKLLLIFEKDQMYMMRPLFIIMHHQCQV